MSYAVPSLQPIRDEIDREVVINAGWVDVTGQRQRDTEYENTTGRTYEVMLKMGILTLRLRSPDGAIFEIPGTLRPEFSFQLKPGESVELVSSSEYPNAGFAFWSERQV